ncbi:MAG: ABC transporter permease [Acidimicrobiia bacterium]
MPDDERLVPPRTGFRSLTLPRVAPRAVGIFIAAAVGLAFFVVIVTDHDQLTAVFGGIGTGALYAAIALGVVLTFKGSGVVNFANGATAMYVAYIYNGLRTQGEVFLPPLPNPLAPIEGLLHSAGATGVNLPDWPTHLGSGTPMAVGPAMAVALLAAVVLGLLFHLLIFRPLRDAPPVAKAVASVGLFILLPAIVTLRFTSQAQAVQPILAKHPVRFPGRLVIPSDDLTLAIIVLVMTAALWAVFRFMRFGLATRAAAENETGAMLIGFSPDRLAGTNWILSTFLTGAFGILAGSVNSFIDPFTVTLLIVPALAAALLGKFSSFWVTTAAAFGIAMAQSWLGFLGTKSWFPHAGTGPIPGIKEALPFLVIVLALYLQGQSLPSRGAVGTERLPFAPRPNHVAIRAILAGGLCLVGLLTLGSQWRTAIAITLVGTVICLSLVILTGFLGQISLAQMTIAGVAGFTLSKLATDWSVPFPVGPLVGAAVAALFGLLTAIPALRVRGVNLAVVTLAFAVTIENFVFKNTSWNGGLNGATVPPPRLFGFAFGPNHVTTFGDGKLPNPFFGLFCLIVVVLLGLVVVNLRRSVTGRQMLAVRSNERAAAAVGISVSGTKMLAFGLAAFVAGLGGALSGYNFGSVTGLTFGSIASLTIFAFAYLGGISSVTGAVLGGCLVTGGIAFTALDEWFHIDQKYSLFLGGLGLIITAVLNPEGIAGAFRAAARYLSNRAPGRGDRHVARVAAAEEA